MYYDHKLKEIMVDCAYCKYETIGAIYSTNRNILDIAKERIGEEKLLSLFGVKKVEPKIGQLCWFWDLDYSKKNICSLKDIRVPDIGGEHKYFFTVDKYSKNCKPLTKEEILAYADKAEG